jgi:hypothetical protein
MTKSCLILSLLVAPHRLHPPEDTRLEPAWRRSIMFRSRTGKGRTWMHASTEPRSA